MAGGLVDLYSKGSGSGGSKGSGPIDLYAGSTKPSGGGGGGGLWGFVKNLGSDAEHAASGIPTGVEQLGKAAFVDPAVATYDTLTGNQAGFQKAINDQTRFGQGIKQQYAQQYGPLLHGNFGQFGHEFYQHPLGPILDALTVATLGAGGVARAGKLAADAGLIDQGSGLANLSKPVNLTVPDFGTNERVLVKESSAHPLVRWRQQLTNAALNRLPSETPILGSTARAVRALQRGPMKEAARLDVQARDFNQAWQKLSKPEQVAWHLKARGLTPATYRVFLEQQPEASAAMVKTLADPAVSEAFAQPSAALSQALTLGRELSDRLTALRVGAGHLDELTALEAPYRHMRLVSGATMEPVTAESPALVAARTERDALAAAHEKALQADEAWLRESQARNLGSLSPQDAQARLAQLDKIHNDLVENMVPHSSPYGGILSKQEQLRRNFEASRGVVRRTVAQEERDLADAKIQDLIDKYPNHPVFQQAARLLAERDQLRRLLDERSIAHLGGEEGPALPEAPAHLHGSVPPPSNPVRDSIVTLAHRLEAAQAKVDRLAGSTAQTGEVRMAGGKSVEQLIHEIEAAGGEHPFHVPDSATVPGIRSRWASKPSGYAAPAQGVKQSRLVLASKGIINPYENALGKDFARYRDQAEAQLLHDELVKHAAVVPPGEPVPHGWAELKLNRGQPSAPYPLRVAAGLERELSAPSLVERLRGSGSLGELPASPEGAPMRLVVPHQVQRLLEDESRSYATRLSAIRRVPLNIWKALVLGLRPAFFANITIGNSILGTLQMAPGRWGFVGWLNQVLPGFEKVAGPKLTEATMKDVFPEQVTGTFGGSVAPAFGTSKVGRVAQRASAGVMPATIGL